MSSTYKSNTRASIEANNEKFASCISSADAAGMAALYSASARLLPPDSDIIQGHQAIQAFWQAFLDSGVTGGKLETVDVEEAGDNLAREVGKFSVQIRQGTETITGRGKYVVIWKQENGAWKMDIDIWNGTP